MADLLSGVNASVRSERGSAENFYNHHKGVILISAISLALLFVTNPIAGAITTGVMGLGLAGFAIKSKLTQQKVEDAAARVLIPERERTVQTSPRILQSGEHLPVTVPIARCDNLRLSNGNLGEIFGRINRGTFRGIYTMQDPYIRGLTTQLFHNSEYYNGVREAVKTRSLEVAFDLIQREGTEEAKGILGTFSELQIANLKLARYLYTSGWVHEISMTKSRPDNFHARSADIYRAYAEQLGVPPETIAWTAQLFMDRGEPINTGDKKFDLICELFRTVDILDAGRGFPQSTRDLLANKVETRMHSIFVNPGSAIQKLREYAERMDAKTDPHRDLLEGTESEIQNTVFKRFSEDGKECWSQLINL